jgi:hypothetical protein
MFIHIPIPSTVYTATAKGSVTKDVACERCGHTYSYRMSRFVIGIEKVFFSSSRGPEKAAKNAQTNLAKSLETAHDDVPCPECGWHQPAHVAYVRSQKYPELKNFAGAFFVIAGYALGVMLFFITVSLLVIPRDQLKASSFLQFALIVLIIASPGILLRGLRRLLALSYRPNG